MAIQTAKPIQWGRVIRRGVGCYALILFWEFATIPAMSHSNASWRGVGLSVLALPVGTYFLLHAGARAATCFVYVCGAALLFVPRFLVMDRFSLWVCYQAPSDLVILISWIAFSLGLGGVCWFAGVIQK